MNEYWNRPCAMEGLTSYRYPTSGGGWVMIGAVDHADAISEANRSLTARNAEIDILEVWDGFNYVSAKEHATMTPRKPKPVRPEDSHALPGMESTDQDRETARQIAEADELSARMRKPLADISAKAGKMERESPLFYGKGENPLLF